MPKREFLSLQLSWSEVKEKNTNGQLHPMWDKPILKATKITYFFYHHLKLEPTRSYPTQPPLSTCLTILIETIYLLVFSHSHSNVFFLCLFFSFPKNFQPNSHYPPIETFQQYIISRNSSFCGDWRGKYILWISCTYGSTLLDLARKDQKKREIFIQLILGLSNIHFHKQFSYWLYVTK